MRRHSISQLPDHVLESHLVAADARESAATAEVLVLLAEVDRRKLFVPAGFPSILQYCIGRLNLSEAAAFKRIRAARAGLRCPSVIEAIAGGRVHLGAVVVLAPYLSKQNAEELLEAAAGKRRAEVEQLVRERFPKLDEPAMVAPVAAASGGANSPGVREMSCQLTPGSVVPTPEPRPRVDPIAPERFAIQVTVGAAAHGKLQYARELLGHQIPTGDLAEILEWVLDAAIEKLEKRKFAATSRPRRLVAAKGTNPRHVPAEVRRVVWRRDEGRCTFVSECGNRCPATRLLEFDHVEPVARGGEASVGNLRLRCRAHNQYAAEQAFGAVFMERKREEACSGTQAATERAVRMAGNGHHRPEASNPDLDVTPWLRQLGFRADDVRRAAVHCAGMTEATLEERVRAGIVFLAPAHRRPGRAVASAA